MNKNDKEQLEKAELFDQLEKLNGNLEEIWIKLDLVAHFLQELSNHSILSKEVDEALIMLARAHSKELDQEYKVMENVEAQEV